MSPQEQRERLMAQFEAMERVADRSQYWPRGCPLSVLTEGVATDADAEVVALAMRESVKLGHCTGHYDPMFGDTHYALTPLGREYASALIATQKYAVYAELAAALVTSNNKRRPSPESP